MVCKVDSNVHGIPLAGFIFNGQVVVATTKLNLMP